VSRGAEFAAILDRDATVGVDEVARIVNEAQEVDRVREGFGPMLDAVEGPAWVVTAGPVGTDRRIGAGHLLAEVGRPDVRVLGSELADDPDGGVRVVRYCGREQKIPRIEAALGESLSGRPSVVAGDSATDAPMMDAAAQSWALGDGALETATIDATEDRHYRGVAVSAVILDAFHAGDDPGERVERARTRARGLLSETARTLPPLGRGPRADDLTLAVTTLYDELRDSR
jgi:phosphoserine phosphatase